MLDFQPDSVSLPEGYFRICISPFIFGGTNCNFRTLSGAGPSPHLFFRDKVFEESHLWILLDRDWITNGLLVITYCCNQAYATVGFFFFSCVLWNPIYRTRSLNTNVPLKSFWLNFFHLPKTSSFNNNNISSWEPKVPPPKLPRPRNRALIKPY